METKLSAEVYLQQGHQVRIQQSLPSPSAAVPPCGPLKSSHGRVGISWWWGWQREQVNSNHAHCSGDIASSVLPLFLVHSLLPAGKSSKAPPF